MTDDEFRTRVSGIAGRWPPAPDQWSFSSLREAQACPRQWGLSRALYPGIWEGFGYPPRPSVAALLGQVAHRCLEWILKAFQAVGCSGPRDPRAVETLRALGGYTFLINRALEEILDGLGENPRMSQRLPELRTSMERYIPDLRLRVQSLVSRMEMAPADDERRGEDASAPNGRHTASGGLSAGSYAEIELTADALGMRGVVDVITVLEDSCAIRDYKSGREQDYHDDQLHTYQVLWALDGYRNPRRLPVGRLEVVYASGSRSVQPLGAAELDGFVERLRERIKTVRERVAARPPPAVPAAENCENCSVRHLCDDYWESDLPRQLSSDGFGDAALSILEKHGARSWRVEHQPTGTETLLHVSTEGARLRPGESVRVLDAAFSQAEPDEPPVLTLTAVSECYVVN